MKKSGSITVFTSLFLAVFLLVFQVLLQSVQIGGGRVQAETGVEEGLYSVFAGYDRELLERYHVFMVDGSYGTGVWKPECMYQTVKKCMEESCRPDGAISGVRGENLWKCSSVSGAITAYTLMSDEHGRGYRAQAVDYMKETLGIQGIQLLMKKYEQQKDIFEQQEKRGSDIDVKQSMDSYEKARKEAGQIRDRIRTIQDNNQPWSRFRLILSTAGVSRPLQKKAFWHWWFRREKSCHRRDCQKKNDSADGKSRPVWGYRFMGRRRIRF